MVVAVVVAVEVVLANQTFEEMRKLELLTESNSRVGRSFVSEDHDTRCESRCEKVRLNVKSRSRGGEARGEE